MNKDIRINVGFFQHHKTKKLIYKLDHKGVTALLSLWTYAAQNKPKGTLTNMDKIDISLASCWEGDENKFVDTLVDIGFLEDNDGTYSIHDWEKNNPYAFHADERSEHARKAARARWGDSNSMQEECSEHAQGNAPSPPPVPIPEPSPEPDPIPETNIAFETFWNAYQKKANPAKCRGYWYGKKKIIDSETSEKRFMTDADREAVMIHTPLYVKSTPDKQFRKGPSSYLYNSAWKDEIIIEHKKNDRQKLTNDRDVSQYSHLVEGPEL